MVVVFIEIGLALEVRDLRAVRGSREGDDGDVVVEGHDDRRFRKGDRNLLAAIDGGFRVGDLLHGVFFLNPRAAAGRPARAVVDADFHAVLRRTFDGVLHHVKPFGRSGFHIAFRNAFRDVENCETADACFVHGVNIRFDAFFRDVAVHPMPPRLRSGLDRRRGETVIKIIRPKAETDENQ